MIAANPGKELFFMSCIAPVRAVRTLTPGTFKYGASLARSKGRDLAKILPPKNTYSRIQHNTYSRKFEENNITSE